ncbi:MAG: hypothetical protein NVS3B18_03300 [Candidatus Dormibacteria bacterium]
MSQPPANPLGEVRSPSVYEPDRAASRRRLAEHRRDRRIALGALVSLVIEDRETLHGALEETLRSEGREEADQVAAESRVVAGALPGPDELCALLVLEIADPAELGRRRSELRRLPEGLRLEVGAQAAAAPRVHAADAEGSVHLLRFQVPGGGEAVRTAAEVSFSVDHPAYRARALLTPAQREALAASLG